MSNVKKLFQSLLPKDIELLADITAHNSDGTSAGQLLTGESIVIQGQGVSVGSRALVRNGEVIRSVPKLPSSQVSL